MDYIPGAESETGSESVITRIGVPLAGPVNVPGQDVYRYSADYSDPTFPPKVIEKSILLHSFFNLVCANFLPGWTKQQWLRPLCGLLQRLQSANDAAANIIITRTCERKSPINSSTVELSAGPSASRFCCQSSTERPLRDSHGNTSEHSQWRTVRYRSQV